jgi:hypothetical protein
MKTLSSVSFFRAFDLMVGASNPGLKRDRWNVEDVYFARDRHSFSGGTHCFAIEIFLLSRPGRNGWELLVVKENWWKAGQAHAIKTFRWSQRTGGHSKAIIAWLRSKEHAWQRPADGR